MTDLKIITKNVYHLLELLQVNANEKILENELNSHWKSLSMVSISDTLKSLNIDCLAVKISLDQLSEIPLPAICHLQIHNGRFVVLKQYKNQCITYYDAEFGEVQESIEKFREKWNGILLLVEKKQNSGERNYIRNKRTIRKKDTIKTMSILTILISLLLICFSNNRLLQETELIPFWIFLIFDGICLFLSIQLLLMQLGEETNLINMVCNNSNSNCKQLQESRASKFLGISVAEIGLVYFAGEIIALILLSSSILTAEDFSILTFLALATFPYVVFSFYYQKFRAKTWCPLCLGIITIILIKSIIAFPIFNSQILNYSSNSLLLSASGFILATAVWLLVRNHFIQSYSIVKLKRDLISVKQNPEKLETLIEAQQSVDIEKLEGEIIKGNSDAAFTITVVTNPTCAPCSIAHKKLNELLFLYADHIKVKYRFLGNPNVDSDSAKISIHAIASTFDGHIKNTEDFLSKWYNETENGQKNLIRKLNSILDFEKFQKIYEQHRNWCIETGITDTPTFFINNKRLPSDIDISDLKFFIRERIESSVQ